MLTKQNKIQFYLLKLFNFLSERFIFVLLSQSLVFKAKYKQHKKFLLTKKKKIYSPNFLSERYNLIEII